MHEMAKESRPGDEAFMRRALALALNGRGLVSPNPMVGAVLVGGGSVVAEGWHEGPGTAHAEAVALERAGGRARGATLYVTLEPCSHQGRTPPCAGAVVDAGVARVVAAMPDPNPIVDGRGLRILRAAGIQVEEGLLAEEAGELVRGFAKHVSTGLPFVTLKLAASLDGKVAASDGSSRWISGEASRQDAHELRAASDAVLVGAGTAMADDPSLTVRLEGYRGRQPLRVVVDGAGRVPPTRALFDHRAPTLVVTSPMAPPSALASWAGAGAEVLVLDEEGSGSGIVRMDALMQALGKRDAQSVLIEGGPTLAWSAVEAGVVDRLVLYVAPMLLGGASAPGVLGGRGVPTMTDALRVKVRGIERVAEDLKVVADVHGDR